MLTACQSPSRQNLVQAPSVAEGDKTHQDLLNLPAPSQKIVAAIYSYQDRTGKYEPNDNFQTLSRAVTQGADSIIIKALHDAGNGTWFTVLERAGIANLLRERQILRENVALSARAAEAQKDAESQQPIAQPSIPPLAVAGVLLEGGIVSFDSNQTTGGFGARYLGIGGDVKHRQDVVAVYLRASSVLTGEVLANVNVTKTLYSVGVGGSVFRYVSENGILELETGYTFNEPEYFALKQAIEKAVIALVFEGASKGIWGFGKETPQLRKQFENYLDEKKQLPAYLAAHQHGSDDS